MPNLADLIRQEIGRIEPRPKAAFYHEDGQIPPSLQEVLARNTTAPRPDYPYASGRQMIAPYYGDYYEKEQQKAKEYTEKTFPLKQWQVQPGLFGRLIGQAPRIATSEFRRENVPAGFFNLRHNTAAAREKPYAVENQVHEIGPHFDGPGNRIVMNPFGHREPLSYGSRRPEATPEKEYLSVLEHEAGHATGNGFSMSPYFDDQTHLSKPVELENGLGRINRENFLMHGTRFDANSLQEYLEQQMQLPEKERFQGFSNEGLRVWDVLQRSLNGKTDDEKQLLKDAKLLIPAMVQNNITAKKLFG